MSDHFHSTARSVAAVVATLVLASCAAEAQTVNADNPAIIAVPANGTQGQAAPYPSEIQVTGVTGTIGGLEVQVRDLDHGAVEDIALSLVGPDGSEVLLMYYAGSGSVSGRTLTFRDGSSAVPEFGSIGSGRYRPTSYASANGAPRASCSPSQTPPGDMSLDLSSFEGQDPNGTWQLYVCDMLANDTGTISGGWELAVQVDTVPAD